MIHCVTPPIASWANALETAPKPRKAASASAKEIFMMSLRQPARIPQLMLYGNSDFTDCDVGFRTAHVRLHEESHHLLVRLFVAVTGLRRTACRSLVLPRKDRDVQVNVTNVIRPPSKLLLALEGGRASLDL